MHRFVLIAAMTCLAAFGCGGKVYEDRLDETRKYFTHLDKIEQSLGPAWKELGIDIRPPRPFEFVPKPVPTKNEDGNLETPAVDPRQPDYVNLELPGLLAAWKSSFDVDIEGKAASRMGYFYVLSNYWMFSDAQTAKEAPKFTEDFMNQLWSALGTADKERRLENDFVPKGKNYHPRQDYQVSSLRPPLVIDGARYTFDTYVLTAGDVQVVLLAVVPEMAKSASQISERIPLMLEVLKLAGDKPRVGVKAGAPSGNAAPPPAVSF